MTLGGGGCRWFSRWVWCSMCGFASGFMRLILIILSGVIELDIYPIANINLRLVRIYFDKLRRGVIWERWWKCWNFRVSIKFHFSLERSTPLRQLLFLGLVLFYIFYFWMFHIRLIWITDKFRPPSHPDYPQPGVHEINTNYFERSYWTRHLSHREYQLKTC